MLHVGKNRMKALILEGQFIQLRIKCGAFWVFMAVSCVALCENLVALTFSRPLSICFNCSTSFFFQE